MRNRCRWVLTKSGWGQWSFRPNKTPHLKVVTVTGENASQLERTAELEAVNAELLAACEAAWDLLDALYSFYGTGLDVANWHMNGDMQSWDSFFDDNATGNELENLQSAIAKAKGIPEDTESTEEAS